MAKFDLNSWICPKCGAFNPSDTEYCAKCEYVINENEVPKKAKSLNDNAAFSSKKVLND